MQNYPLCSMTAGSSAQNTQDAVFQKAFAGLR